nr:ribonuclease H-like domain-containing protein [Tanacetum cinerariifolium]
MSTRTKPDLGFKEYNRSDEVFNLSTPSVFDPEPENREVKSLYKSDKSSKSATYDFAFCVSSPKTNDSFSTVDVKILPKSDVKDPSPTNGFPSFSFKENVKPPRNLCNNSGIADRIPCKNNFVRTKTCFVCGSKSHLIKDYDVYDNVDNFLSVALKAASVPAGIRNSSASISDGRSIPAASRNRPTSIHADRHIPAGRFNKPSLFPAGRSVPTGWTNHNFNLFSVSQICDKKNKVLFTDDECLVLTKEFQLPDESQVVLRIPRRRDLYTFNLSDIQPEKHINCLLAKASLEESTKWHRRMAHVNFKTINKLAKNGLVKEAVSTACYVLNRVSITNPHNKTPYELLSGKGLGQEWYFDLDYLIDSLGYTRFKTNTPAGTQDTNINAGTQDVDSESECDEQAILVLSFPSNSFSDSKTAKMLHQAEIKTRRNLVLAVGDPVGSIVSTGSVPTGSVPTGSVPAQSIPAGSIPAISVPAGDVLAGSVDSAGCGDPAISESVPAVFDPVHADNSTLPPGSSLGLSEHSTRFLSPSDLGNHQPKTGIFSSSSYDDNFCADVTNLASSVNVDPVDTKRILKNKRDARGIVVRNKARLVAQGHQQEKGIDYDEVYVDDIIFGSTNKAWCDEFEVLMKGEFEMSAMGELTFFLGLKVKQLLDGIFISQDKYVKDMLKKFNMESVRNATTPYEVPKPKSKDEPNDAVNVYLLISWQCKKQTIVATSSTKAEYVAATSCCGQASNAAGHTGVPAGVPVGGDGADAAAANEVPPPPPPPVVPLTHSSSSTPGPSTTAQDTLVRDPIPVREPTPMKDPIPVREPTPSPVREPTTFWEPTPEPPSPPPFLEDLSEDGGGYVSPPKSNEAPPTTAATAACGVEDSVALTNLSLKLD